jgi:hypothetical protein
MFQKRTYEFETFDVLISAILKVLEALNLGVGRDLTECICVDRFLCSFTSVK